MLFSTITVNRPVVFEKGLALETMPAIVKEKIQELGLVAALEAFPVVNLTIVQEFYANFPVEMTFQVKLKSIEPLNVRVRDKWVNISLPTIRRVLGLESPSRTALKRIREYINTASLPDLANMLYSDPSRCPPPVGFLQSQFMSEMVKVLCFVVRSLLTPSTQTSKVTKRQAAFIAFMLTEDNPRFPVEYFIFQNIHKAAVDHGNSTKSSLVYPGLITLLCKDAGVTMKNADAIVPPIPPLDLVSIHKSVS